MMKSWSFYDAATGIFSGDRFASNGAGLEENTPAGHAALEGEHDPASWRVDIATKELVAYTPEPIDRSAAIAAEANARRLSLIASLERRQSRPAREIALALAQGQPAPEAALQSLTNVEAQIMALRSALT